MKKTLSKNTSQYAYGTPSIEKQDIDDVTEITMLWDSDQVVNI